MLLSLCSVADQADSEEAEEIRKLASSLAQLTGGGGSAVLSLAEGYLSLLEGRLMAARESLQQGERTLSLSVAKYCI